MLRKKIAGNWHQVDIWPAKNCIVAFVSGGLSILSLTNFEIIKYLPLYNFSKFLVQNDILFLFRKDHRVYQVQDLNLFMELVDEPVLDKSYDLDISAYEVIEQPRAIDYSADVLVCAYKQKGLEFFSRNTGRKISQFVFPGYSFIDDIKLYENKVYIADVFGLRVLDIQDIYHPLLDDRHIHKGWPKDIAVRNNYVYVADVLGIKIYNKSDNFAFVGSYETNKNRVAKVFLYGDFAFLACEAVGLKVLDVRNPASPKLVSGLISSKGVWDIFGHADNIYLAAYTEGLIKICFENIKEIETVARYNDGSEIIGVHVTAKSVFISCSFFGFRILNLDCELVSSVRIENGRCWAIITDGNLLYAACGNGGVLIYDIRDVVNPFLITKLDSVDARDIVLHNEMIYVADGKNGVEVYKRINSGVLDWKYNIPSSAFTRGIMVDDSFIYKADGDGGLEVYEY